MNVIRPSGTVIWWLAVCGSLALVSECKASVDAPGGGNTLSPSTLAILICNACFSLAALVLLARRELAKPEASVKIDTKKQAADAANQAFAQIRAAGTALVEEHQQLAAKGRAVFEELTQLIDQRLLLEKKRPLPSHESTSPAPRQSAPATPLATNATSLDFFWPAIFNDEPMNHWRREIDEKLRLGDMAALDIFLAVGRLNLSVRKHEPHRKVAETLFSLSEQVWGYAGQAEPQFPIEWQAATQKFLSLSGVQLEIVPALERDRFDMDFMVAEATKSGGRNFVKKPLSWAIRDVSLAPPRLLHHARVITE